MFQVRLRRVKAEGKIFLGDGELQVVAERGILNVPRQFGKSGQLILFLRHIQVPGFQVDIQALKQTFRLPVRPHPDAGKRQKHRKQYEEPPTPHNF